MFSIRHMYSASSWAKLVPRMASPHLRNLRDRDVIQMLIIAMIDFNYITLPDCDSNSPGDPRRHGWITLTPEGKAYLDVEVKVRAAATASAAAAAQTEVALLRSSSRPSLGDIFNAKVTSMRKVHRQLRLLGVPILDGENTHEVRALLAQELWNDLLLGAARPSMDEIMAMSVDQCRGHLCAVGVLTSVKDSTARRGREPAQRQLALALYGWTLVKERRTVYAGMTKQALRATLAQLGVQRPKGGSREGRTDAEDKKLMRFAILEALSERDRQIALNAASHPAHRRPRPRRTLGEIDPTQCAAQSLTASSFLVPLWPKNTATTASKYCTTISGKVCVCTNASQLCISFLVCCLLLLYSYLIIFPCSLHLL